MKILTIGPLSGEAIKAGGFDPNDILAVLTSSDAVSALNLQRWDAVLADSELKMGNSGSEAFLSVMALWSKPGFVAIDTDTFPYEDAARNRYNQLGETTVNVGAKIITSAVALQIPLVGVILPNVNPLDGSGEEAGNQQWAELIDYVRFNIIWLCQVGKTEIMTLAPPKSRLHPEAMDNFLRAARGLA